MAYKNDVEYLAVFGLAPGASFKSVKSLYRGRAQRCHPDRDPTPKGEAEFKEISVAYARLELRWREGRWGESWGESAPRSAPAGAGKKPAPQAPPSAERSWKGAREWGRYKFELFEFNYLSTGYPRDIAEALAKSYVQAASSAAERKGAWSAYQRQKATHEMAMGYLKWLSVYKEPITETDLALFRAALVKRVWIERSPGVMDQIERARSRVGLLLGAGHEPLVEALGANLYWMDGGRVFSCSRSIRERAGERLTETARAFHKEIAAWSGSMERVERESEAGAALPLAIELLRCDPELFEIYDRGGSGWFNFEDELYARKGASPLRELLRSSLPWPAKAARALKSWPLEALIEQLNQDPEIERAKRGAQALERAVIEAGAMDQLAAELQTRGMRRASPGRLVFDKIRWSAEPLMGRALSRWASRLGRGQETAESAARRAILAALEGEAEPMRSALADYKFLGGAGVDLKAQGVSIASICALREIYGEAAGGSLDQDCAIIREIFGEGVMRQADASGAAPRQWQERARAAKEREASRARAARASSM